eukprot:scaffold46950_cov33-Phaeocystis_antarctica.AAC.1
MSTRGRKRTKPTKGDATMMVKTATTSASSTQRKVMTGKTPITPSHKAICPKKKNKGTRTKRLRTNPSRSTSRDRPAGRSPLRRRSGEPRTGISQTACCTFWARGTAGAPAWGGGRARAAPTPTRRSPGAPRSPRRPSATAVRAAAKAEVAARAEEAAAATRAAARAGSVELTVAVAAGATGVVSTAAEATAEAPAAARMEAAL